MQIDEVRLEEFVGQIASEVLGAWGIASVHVGVRLGLYAELLEGSASAGELATRTGYHPRLLDEWLTGQAVAGYVSRDGDTYSLSPEQAMVLGTVDSPYYLGGLSEVLAATIQGQERIDAAYRGDGALAWGDQQSGLSGAFERSFGPVYRAALLSDWLPALDGVEQRLATGAEVADIGAGHGTAVALMAEAFPASRFVAVDLHRESLDAAEKTAGEAGVGDRVTVQQTSGTEFDGGPYDLVTFFDALHDMGDPEQVIARTRSQLRDDGVVLVVEPRTCEGPDDAEGAIAARLFYPGSALLCTPSGLAGGATALGNQVPDDTWRRLFLRNGFTTFRRAAETPFNRVFEARP